MSLSCGISALLPIKRYRLGNASAHGPEARVDVRANKCAQIYMNADTIFHLLR